MHFIGVGGTGLSAIARVLLESGYTVSGSDRARSPLAQAVKAAGAKVYFDHRAENVNGADVVIRSSAVPEDNVEVQAARSAGIPVLKRADFLGRLMKGRKSIAVAGSHGKTTTTAMIAWALTVLKQDPTFIVGGVVANLETNARAGKGATFVIEADEYDYMFLGLKPQMAVITNVEHDHPDMFPTPRDFRAAFRQFVNTLPPDGTLISCGDDPGASDMNQFADQQGYRTLRYGRQDKNYDYYLADLAPNDQGGFSFEAYRQEELLSHFDLQVPGVHNVENALATVAVLDQLDLSVEAAADALAKFRGVGRRFQVLGEVKGVTVIDDYAHHPTEIRATLAAARTRYPGQRIWAVWEPHTYTRTRALSAEFAEAFDHADVVLVTEVFRSREPVDPHYSAEQVVEAMQHPHARFVDTLQNAKDDLLSHLSAGDVLLVLSAGDATQVSQQVFDSLSETERSE